MNMRLKIVAFALCLLFVQTASAGWIKQNTKTFAWFKDVFFLKDGRTGWIGGGDGTFLKTTDGGKTWNPVRKFTADTIHQIIFADERIGILLMERNMFSRGKKASSYLLKTLDGGENWVPFEFPEGSRQRVTKLLFNERGTGMAFGESGLFYRLREDGRDWVKIPAAIHYLMLDGAFTGESAGAIVGGGGTILFTDDSGFTWTKASVFGDNTSKLNAVFFIDDKTGWTVGNDGKIFKTTGSGKLWRQQNSGTTNNLNDVCFTDANNGWVVGDDGTIMRTSNGGTSWYPVNTTAKHRLEKVVFAGKTGWAVGFGGTLLQYDESSTNEAPQARPGLQRRNG
jgi:photosystem II stability/assembly factor-like uncharacterized protein